MFISVRMSFSAVDKKLAAPAGVLLELTVGERNAITHTKAKRGKSNLLLFMGQFSFGVKRSRSVLMRNNNAEELRDSVRPGSQGCIQAEPNGVSD
jgi:hypothetical protein